jgi:hypothetical protein
MMLGTFIIISVTFPRPHEKRPARDYDHFEDWAVSQALRELLRPACLALDDFSSLVNGYCLELEFLLKIFLCIALPFNLLFGHYAPFRQNVKHT